MFIRIKTTPNSPRKSFQLDDHELEALEKHSSSHSNKRKKQKATNRPIEDILAIQEEKRITTGFNDIYGEVYECLDFYRVIKKPLSKAAKILKTYCFIWNCKTTCIRSCSILRTPSSCFIH